MVYYRCGHGSVCVLEAEMKKLKIYLAHGSFIAIMGITNSQHSAMRMNPCGCFTFSAEADGVFLREMDTMERMHSWEWHKRMAVLVLAAAFLLSAITTTPPWAVRGGGYPHGFGLQGG